MKKNVRNALAISGLAIAIGASGLTLTASANSGKTSNNLRFESQQNPSKIARVKKIDKSEQTKLHRRTLPGIVSAISENSLTLKKGNKTFTVNTSTETRILNKNWNAITLSEIKIGDKVRVIGTLSETTITAKTIRDISLQ
jgi:hypothetical protein